MAKVLIVYGTVEGQTEKIARAIGEELERLGHETDIRNAAKLPRAISAADYDGVLIGAPVHASGYPGEVKKWTKANERALNRKPSAFFSVCLGILQKNDAKAQSDVRRFVQEFFDASGWWPKQWAIFAGALRYSKYGFIKRLIMKNISAKAGSDTDTSRDYEYTNWGEVSAFAKAFAVSLEVTIASRRIS